MAINEERFRKVWPGCLVKALASVEVVCALALIFTEVCTVGANFWTTNVFAGAWCGIIMLAHFIALFVAGCGVPKSAASFRAVVITVIALAACGAMIGFDAYFIAQPSACILTPQCSSYTNSTTVFSYVFQSSFWTVFHNVGPFSSYTQSQTKFLFEVIQLGVGGFCFILCIVYMIIYYVCRSKASGNGRVEPAWSEDNFDGRAQRSRPNVGAGGRQGPNPRNQQGYSNDFARNRDQRY